MHWKDLYSDKGAIFDKEYDFNVDNLTPYITWGTSPEDGISISELIPNPKNITETDKNKAMQKALDYMGLKPGKKLTDYKIQKAFIGSCTNGRLEDLREAANFIKGKQVAENVEALIVPGSGIEKRKPNKKELRIYLLKQVFSGEIRDALCV